MALAINHFAFFAASRETFGLDSDQLDDYTVVDDVDNLPCKVSEIYRRLTV